MPPSVVPPQQHTTCTIASGCCARHPRACGAAAAVADPHHHYHAVVPSHHHPPLAAPAAHSRAGTPAPCHRGPAATVPREVGRIIAAARHCKYGCARSKADLVKALQSGAAQADAPVDGRTLEPSLNFDWQAHRQRVSGGGGAAGRGGIAVLLAGQVRTLPLYADLQRALRSYLRLLAVATGASSVHIFAALQRNCTYSGAGFVPGHNTMGCQKGRPCNLTAFEVIRNRSRDLIPEAEVDAALGSLGAPYSVRYTSAEELLHSVPRCNTGSNDSLVQYGGISLAYQLMTTHERRANQSFQWVARLRPDACQSVRPSAGLADLRRDLLSDTAGCIHDDQFALLPRWAAIAYGRTLETITDCALLPHACEYMPELDHALHDAMHSKMPMVASFLRYGLAPRRCTDPYVTLVRPGNAEWNGALAACRASAFAAEQLVHAAGAGAATRTPRPAEL